ncbi:uncharacterized protein LOC131428679 [Malaya genurostris]|uniref:uncharacterized protein LOC131428679 n=1 Tax=Malaya genurostris TaxID=325434 RepID=UPI0026F38152|nr:uncharacterized protein LOC131428679 [Malaya genurostris]
MGRHPDPPDGSVLPTSSHTLPPYLNTGDTIDKQTLLMKATNDIGEQCLPSNPFIIHQSVEAVLGTDPTKVITASKEAGGTRNVLRTTSKKVYNALIAMKTLINGQAIEVIPHPTLNIVQGIIFYIDTKNLSSEELVRKLNSQNVVAVRRITNTVDGNQRNTPLAILSFLGSYLPEHIYIGLIRTAVRQYYPYPLLCYNCGKFGHGSRSCSQPPACLNCSGTHTSNKENPCNAPSKCGNCSGNHPTRYRKCPAYMKEEEIIKLKVTKNISFSEARAFFKNNTSEPSYADTVKNRLDSNRDEKDRTINLLREEITKLREYQKADKEKDTLIQQLKTQLAEAKSQHLEVLSEMIALRKAFTSLSKQNIHTDTLKKNTRIDSVPLTNKQPTEVSPKNNTQIASNQATIESMQHQTRNSKKKNKQPGSRTDRPDNRAVKQDLL